MAADKEIMRQIETLRLDRPGRVLGSAIDASGLIGEQTIAALRELASTFREEAELWTKSGARGWKSSETEAYLIAQAVDDVAGQLDNASSAPAREPFVQTEAATTHERLDDLVSSAVAEGRGLLRAVTVDVPGIGESDVTDYLSGAVDTLPGLAEALVPGSIPRMSEADNPFSEHARAKLATLPDFCTMCDTDTHRCHGCGEPVEHGKHACDQCELIHADGPPPPCCEHMLNPDEDPAPWCDCRSDDDMARGHAGPCKRQAHLRADHDTPAELPKTWESETMTADGHTKPGVAQTLAPTLGQPGDMGAGYSHDYVPPGGRRVTFAELLTTVPVAALPPHVSNSQIDTVGDCGAKYRMQRVDQLPQIPQWANIGGTTFHAAVEAFERTIMNLPHDKAQASGWKDYDCERTWRHHFEAQIAVVQSSTTVPISSWRAARKGAEGRAWWEVNGPLMLRRYLDARPSEPTFDVPVVGVGGIEQVSGIEAELTIDVPTNYGPVPFVAKLDRVTAGHVPGHPAIGALVIRDYKTSYERPTDTTQLGDYAWTLRSTLARCGGPLAEVPILGTFFDARRGEWTEPVDLLAAHSFESFQYRVTAAHAQKRALTTGPTPARPSSYCGGCSVRYACPVMASKS